MAGEVADEKANGGEAMSRKRKAISFIVVGAGLLCLGAYVSASYILSPAVSDQGGGAATSSSYELRGSIGGPVIVTGEKTAASPSYTVEAHSIGLITYRDPAAPPPPPAAGAGGGGCAPGAGGAAGLMALPVLLACLAARRRSR